MTLEEGKNDYITYPYLFIVTHINIPLQCLFLHKPIQA